MRETYLNGDEIGLKATGCDGCSPCSVNGVLCHERGCPDSWRDYQRVCGWCGDSFWPSDPHDEFCCDDCSDSYHN